MRDGPAETLVGRSVRASGGPPDGPWSGAGAILGSVSGSAARRPPAKPLHPVGALLRGRLVRDGVACSGAAWIDGAGDDEVVVRLSRAAGLPLALPDVHGMALRHGAMDLLLSSGGAAVLTRHVLAPRLSPGRTAYTSLLPFRGPRGSVMVGALPEPRCLPRDPAGWAAELAREPWSLTLVWATTTGTWQRFGRLEVGGPAGADLDPPIRFDPLAAPPGLVTYGWVRRLREPAYLAARAAHPGGTRRRRTAPDPHGPTTHRPTRTDRRTSERRGP
jgi:hypothetical protein